MSVRRVAIGAGATLTLAALLRLASCQSAGDDTRNPIPTYDQPPDERPFTADGEHYHDHGCSTIACSWWRTAGADHRWRLHHGPTILLQQNPAAVEVPAPELNP